MLKIVTRKIKLNIFKNILIFFGLFLFFAFSRPANAATSIYYSVGQSVADLQTSTSTVSISSSTGLATFSTAQTGNIGVGDRLTVATTTIYYISGKASSTAWYVMTATGTLPQATTTAPVTSIKREYTSLASAVAGAVDANHAGTSDLVAGDFILNLPCYYDSGPDTSAVDVTGYTTGTTTFLKIYTPTSTVAEANFSQRHQGKWDDLRYNLVVNNADALTIREGSVLVEGLQNRLTNVTANYMAIRVRGDIGPNNILQISNNILRGATSTASWHMGIDIWGTSNNAGSVARIWNNIIHDFRVSPGNSAVGIGVEDGMTYYIYNNTVYNCGVGFQRWAGTAILKNNLIQNTGSSNYVGTIDASSTNNISQDATSPNATYRNYTVAFSDVINKDFHLAASSSARNVGVDLSADAGLAINADIDGHARSGSWDIGADEGATSIYYSVGQNTTDHKTGSPTVTVSSTTGLATFSLAQTATNMGVGDVITYGSDKCYITGKASTTAWYCQTATGTMPVATTSATVASIAHAYASLSSAESGATDSNHLNTADLVTGNYQLNFPCYYDTGSDVTPVTVSGYITAANNYIKIYTPTNATTETNRSQRHQGVWNSEKYSLNTVDSAYPYYPISVDVAYLAIHGLQVVYGHDAVAPAYAVRVQAGSVPQVLVVSDSIIKGDLSKVNVDSAIHIENGESLNFISKIYNNIIYDTKDYGIRDNAYKVGGVSGKNYVYNNLIYNCATYGISTRLSSNRQILAKNNIVQSCANGGYFGAFDDFSTNNISYDGSAPGSNAMNTTTVLFADVTNKDFHLAASSSARNRGADLSADPVFAFNTDIDGHQRVNQGTGGSQWDIGADEGAMAIYYSVGQNTSDHKTGSPTVTVSSSTGLATFSVAQTATNMGVGDVVTYNTTNKCYITSKASTTAWYCSTATGTPPVAVTGATVNSITHAFTSLSSAEAGASDSNHLNTSDLATGNYQLNFPCYYDSGPDTTTVTVDGWTTSQPNYIKIYAPNDILSEVNASQRHQGKIGKGYSLIPGATNNGLEIYEENTRVEGLAIGGTNWNTNGSLFAIINMASGSNDIIVSGNLLFDLRNAGVSEANGYRSGVAGTGEVKIYNNIIFNRGARDDHATYGIRPYNSTNGRRYYIYNNTVVGMYKGIEGSPSGSYTLSTIKNNLVQDGVTNYSIAPNFIGENNVSSDNTSPNVAYQNLSAEFADSANSDFHILSTDSVVKDAGADLSADQSLSFNADIEGQSRQNDMGWDIGADEAAKAVYYSVGQSAADLQTGSSTVTVSSSTGLATFQTAQTGNIGVGDRVTIATNTIYYISGKASSTAWYVVTATGTLPQATTSAPLTSIKREYTSLAAAVSGASDSNHLNGNNLATSTIQLNLPCYYDTGADIAAVTVDGYTTGASTYIKIYTPNNTATEANFSQRHQGKWDNGKYRLSTGLSAINVYDNFVTIDGLQSRIDSHVGNVTNIRVSNIDPLNEINISNNIITFNDVGDPSWDPTPYGVSLSDPDMLARVWNNIVYGFRDETGLNGVGMVLISFSSAYVYNNVVNDSFLGFSKEYGYNAIMKNNIAQNNNTDYFVVTAVGSYSHNISSDATATGTNSKINTNVLFVDRSNKDFHLSSADTSAKNAGANLGADLGFAFTSDIDGHIRSGSWDIGADEGATAIYYSVGQNTSDHKTGSPTVTISSTTGLATFSVAQTATNMGVGDVITYGSDKCYITGKASTTAWYCQTATGTMPVATTSATVASIAHAYVSLSSAESGATDSNHLNTADLVTGNYQLNFPAYYDSGPDTAAVTVDGYSTGASNFISIYTPNNESTEVNKSQRHQGIWDNYKYRLSVTGWTHGIRIITPSVRIDGMQIEAKGAAWQDWGIVDYRNAVAYDSRVTNSILRSDGDGTVNYKYGVKISGIGTSSRLILANNYIYDIGGASGTSNAGIDFNYTATSVGVFAYNNTIANVRFGMYSPINANKIKAINNIVHNVTDGFFTGTNSYDPASDYNISSISGDAPNATFSTSSITVQFADAANKDFHLAASSSPRNRGSNLSADQGFAFSSDIDGHARSGSWDIGADEGATAIYYSVGQNTSDHKTGSPTVTISSTTGLATFSVAQTATNMGVGDVVTYGTTNKCYISGKASTSAWYCATATGTAPVAATDATVNSIAHVFSSLNSAVTTASTTNYLATSSLKDANYQFNIPVYYDSGPDTTAVSVDRWTTAQSNYIKIYTPASTTAEVNQSQRHQGKWDDNKYSLIPNSGTNVFSLESGSKYSVVDGLQISVAGSLSGNAFYTYGSDNSVLVNSILRKEAITTGHNGINARFSTDFKAINNLVYGFDGNGINIDSQGNYNHIVYYNNTVYGCGVGIYASSYNVYFSVAGFGNNMAVNNTVDYDIVDPNFLNTGATNSNNISKDATSPNALFRNKDVQFADAANKDFHLAASSTARNIGAVLSADPYLAFSTDIDGNTRRPGSWSIGADEPANPVYYSVGQTTNDMKTGLPTVTISSGTAVFSIDQTGNIGVGDRVTYNSSSSVAYISGKVSTSTWYVVTATGTMPANITDSPVDSIKREFTSMSGAVAGASNSSHLNTSDLYVSNIQLNLPAYYDSGPDSTTVNVSAYTTALPNYIRLYTPVSTVSESNIGQRHKGKWDGGKYNLSASFYWGAPLIAAVNYIEIDGLQIANTSNNDHSSGLIVSGGSRSLYRVHDNIIRADYVGTPTGGVGITFGGSIHAWNNVIYNFYTGIDNYYTTNRVHTLFNNTIYNCAGNGFDLQGSAGNIYSIKNNIVQNTTGASYEDSIDGGIIDYHSGNISDDNSSPDAAFANKSVAFVEAASRDLHLAVNDAAARNAGTDLSTDANFAFGTDVDGQARGNGSGWDIGADEAPASVYYSVGQNTSDHKTGSPTINIASGTATFSEAQTAVNMGVGDKVTYNTNSFAYVYKKISSTQWKLSTATGHAPADVTGQTVDSIAHVFDSLSGAEAGAPALLGTADLVAGNYQLSLPCYYDSGADTAAVTVDGYTTDLLNYIKIYTPDNLSTEVNQSQRHQGKWDDGKYNLTVATTYRYALQAMQEYTQIIGLQVKQTTAVNGYGGVKVGEYAKTDKVLVDSCVVTGNGIDDGNDDTDTAGILLNGGGKVVNSVVYNVPKSGIFITYASTGSRAIYNTTAYNNGTYGINASNANGDSPNYIKNVYSGGNATADYIVGGGGFNASSSNNMSSDATSPSSGATDCGGHSCRNQVVKFIDTSSSDFRLSPLDVSARNAGTNLTSDLNYAFAIDIAGNARGFGGIWDIGAFEDVDTGQYGKTRIKQGKTIINGTVRIE